jgi:hypothetical protein
MTKFHGFFCNVRQIFCSLHNFFNKKIFYSIFSVFDKIWQEQKTKNINRKELHLETSEVRFECRKSQKKNVTYARMFCPIFYSSIPVSLTIQITCVDKINIKIWIQFGKTHM